MGLPTWIWLLASSLTTCVWLLVGLTVSTFIGYLLMPEGQILLSKIGDMGLARWLATIATCHWQSLWWLLILLALLALLGINTLCCTVQRLWRLTGGYPFLKKRLWPTYWRRLSIHAMHLSLALTLTGYLLSYCLTEVKDGVILTPGHCVTIGTQGLSLQVLTLEMLPYSGKIRSLEGEIVDVRAVVHLASKDSQGTATISFNHSCSWGPWILTIERFSKDTARPWILIKVIKDPATSIYLWSLFSLLISSTLYGFFSKQSTSKEVPSR